MKLIADVNCADYYMLRARILLPHSDRSSFNLSFRVRKEGGKASHYIAVDYARDSFN